MRLHDFFDYHAREHPERVFASVGGRALTYGQADERVDRLASSLAAAGLEIGDRFAFLAKNCLEYAYLFFASSKVGAVPVPLNYRLAPPELAYIIGDSGSKLLIAEASFTQGLESVRGELGCVEKLICLGDGATAGWEGYDAWLESNPSAPPRREFDDTADLYQMYTSGTTGRPKGAILPQRALLANLRQLSTAMDVHDGERMLTVAPMYHAAAAVTSLGVLVSGGTLVIHEDFDPSAVVRTLSEERISRTTLVPAMIQACVGMVPDAGERSYDELRVVAYGASPIAAETLRRAVEVFRCEFAQGFGMTETSAVLTVLTPGDHRRALAGRPELLLSAGRPLPATAIKIVDEAGAEVPPGTIGEIAGRGPQLMRGYWNLPEATTEALRGGWMHTGDAGRLDEEGYLYIEDRVKDMIVSGGENVYPREVENVLFEHPAVLDCAVIGVPSEKWGEAVKAIVVLADGAAATPEEIMEFCQGRLAGYKRPRSVDFVAVIPRNASGKVLKRELRERYWQGQSRRVS